MNRLIRPLHRLPTAILVAGAALAFAPAIQAAKVPTARVFVGDLNLRTSQGQRIMQRRVDAAIKEVCVPASSALLPNVRARKELRECREKARESVHTQLELHGLQKLAASFAQG